MKSEKSLKLHKIMQCNKRSILINNAKKSDTHVQQLYGTFNASSALIKGAPQWLICRMHLHSPVCRGEQTHLSHYNTTKKVCGEYFLSLPHLRDDKTKALIGCVYIFRKLEITLFILKFSTFYFS